MRIRPGITASFLVILFLSFPEITDAQQGIIYWRDGNVSRVDSFTKITVELVYHWWNRHPQGNDRGGYFRELQIPELSEIEFVRQSAQGTAGFYYRVRITGTDGEGDIIDETIPTWDWIDMIMPGNDGKGKTKVTFFHHKRRIPITKITFGQFESE
jgi:hypothetical protein